MRSITFTLTTAFAMSAMAQPAIQFDYNIDSGLRFGVFTWSSTNTQPYWVRVHHSSSDYFTAALLAETDPRFIPSSIAAIYDSAGTLMASISALNTQDVGMNYGTSWAAGGAGSPTMLIPNQFYYVGFAPGGTVFHNNFASDFVGAIGGQRFLLAPAPSASLALVLPAAFALRRRAR